MQVFLFSVMPLQAAVVASCRSYLPLPQCELFVWIMSMLLHS